MSVTSGAGERDVEFIDHLAPLYDELVTKDFDVYHRKRLDPILDRFASEIEGRELLDVGCGTAVVGLAAATRGFTVIGLDHSPKVLDVAREKAQTAGLAERISFVVGDVAALPFTDDRFDVVTCQQMLHHLPEMRPCLTELARVLRPGGRFYIADVTQETTPLKSALRAVRQPLVRVDNVERMSGREAESLGLTGALNSDDEYPIRTGELLELLESVGLAVDSVSFVTRLGYRSWMSPALRSALIDVLSFPWRHSRGDFVFVTGHPPAST
jgi:ubiquinone/menaquinone biosynthesis C-methylase UbiE